MPRSGQAYGPVKPDHDSIKGLRTTVSGNRG